MEQYIAYAEKLTSLNKMLTETLWDRLTYISKKNEWLDTYMNYISSKFFPKKVTISQYDIEERITIIQSTLLAYDTIKNDIKMDHNLDIEIKDFLIKSIEEVKTKAEVAKRATFFEAEKSWYDVLFTWSTFEIKKNQGRIQNTWLWVDYVQHKKSYLHDIDSLQTQIYGPRISDVNEEREVVVSLCTMAYKMNNSKLTPQEDTLFKSFLNALGDSTIADVHQDTKELPARGNLSMEAIMKGTEHIKATFYPNIKRWQIIDKGKAWYSSLFSQKIREYPDKEKDNFNKLLTTIGHEDAGHMVRWDNQEKNGMILSGPWYEDIEEGITKLNEWLLKYSLDDYPLLPNNIFIAVFIGENYNFEDTYTLLRILKKLQFPWEISKANEVSIARSAFTLAQRVKSYYSWDEKWSNRKDVIYFRGEKKLVQYLRSLPNDKERAEFYRKLMTAKVSFEDIFTIDSLLKKLWTDTAHINQNKLVDKVFNVKLQEGAWAFSKMPDDYWEKNIDKNLLQWDFRFNGTQEYLLKEKKALVDLFSIVGYKKYRGTYIQDKQWDILKARDLLKKWNIISFTTDQWPKKGKILLSSLDELKIIIQHDGTYIWWDVVSIKKKDIKALWSIRILNKHF